MYQIFTINKNIKGLKDENGNNIKCFADFDYYNFIENTNYMS